MESVSNIIFYITSFLLMYVQVFFMVTFLQKRGEIKSRKDLIKLDSYPAITVIVPCWNEEKTIDKTVKSLLSVNYPKENFFISLVDDGSTDGTKQVFNTYKDHPQIKLFFQKNSGKHTALNLGLENATTPFIACLDADSYVHPESVTRMMTYFLSDPNIMAVAPVAIVDAPKTLIQKIQLVEYNMSAFTKQMLALVSGMHVTPGTLPIYRKEVFEKIGGFRKAYNTEDGEIALRMHKNHMKIAYCADAYVYTTAPTSVPKLYKQRLRWMYGFINNVIDYRSMLFNPKFGVLGLLSLPSGLIAIFGIIFLFFKIIANILNYIYEKAVQYSVVGSEGLVSRFSFDWFNINTKAIVFIVIIMYIFSVLSIILGTRIVSLKTKFPLYTIPFMIIYSLIAPFWMLRAIYNVATSQSTSWR
jgi:cellulose synthase/poly-beta-1,6-N-acetylglucosamine synthase-like glycosyltransferase